jgi:hypothetical protein
MKKLLLLISLLFPVLGNVNIPVVTPIIQFIDKAETNAQSNLLIIHERESQSSIRINDIGVMGTMGAGVGICPPEILPSYMEGLPGYSNKNSDNYGNYLCKTDSSIMVWEPAFYYKIELDLSAPYFGNKVIIKSYLDFTDTTAAAAQGFVLHRAFIDGGQIKQGFFIDKYSWSLTGFEYNVSGIASSIKNGNPISSSATTKRDATNNYAGSFSNCKSNGQSPADIYGGAWSAAKSRGNDFAVPSIFMYRALALLQVAHGQAVEYDAYCAWLDKSGNKNFPKGNNQSGTDTDDNTISFGNPTDAYWSGRNEARKTGSGVPFNKTTHNGQACGVADLNGNQFGIAQGLTLIGSYLTITNAVNTDSNTKVQITTSAAHGFSVGQQCGIESVVGMTALNDRIWTITDVVDATNFKIASTGGTYTTGGQITQGTFYVLKEGASIKNITGGNSVTTSDHFNGTFVTGNFDILPLTFLQGPFASRMGNGTNQVLYSGTDRTSTTYKLSSCGIPINTSAQSGSGANLFGRDYYYQYFRPELCVISGGAWNGGSSAGVWSVLLTYTRGYSATYVSARSCLLL